MDGLRLVSTFSGKFLCFFFSVFLGVSAFFFARNPYVPESFWASAILAFFVHGRMGRRYPRTLILSFENSVGFEMFVGKSEVSAHCVCKGMCRRYPGALIGSIESSVGFSVVVGRYRYISVGFCSTGFTLLRCNNCNGGGPSIKCRVHTAYHGISDKVPVKSLGTTENPL